MAKKRRNPTSAQPKAPRGIDPNDAKIGPIETWEDVADEEDAFHISRDKVLLEDDVFDEDGPSDEEVLGLSDSDSEAPDQDEDMSDGDGDSDEEEKGEEDKELLEGWGSSKNYYNDPSAPEEAEESEALRLQSKHLSSLSADDFLFNAAEWATADPPSPVASTTTTKVVEQLPSAPLSSLSEEERTKRLHLLHPEFPLLAKEFSELEPLHASLGLSAAAAEAVGETVRSSIAIVKFRALSAYLGVLSMYFAVLTAGDEVALGEGGMQDHGVMEGLVKCRGMWEAVKGLEVEEISSREEQREKKKRRKKEKKKNGEEGVGKDGNMVDVKEGKGEPERKKVKVYTTAAASEAPSKKSRAEPTKPESDFSDSDIEIDFAKPTPTTRPLPPATSTSASASHFGDPTHLSHPDALSKSAKKRTLRFYTSQIVSKSSTRASAAQSHSGDMDLPHKERAKERAIRLQAEAARKRSAVDPATDLGYSSGGEETRPTGRRGRNKTEEEGEEEEEEDEYMRLLKTSGKEKKAAKKAAHDQARDALCSGAQVYTEGEEAGGKRAIGYTISKNKGLTPFRKKEVRNPRVKKKMKYEAAKKKLGSVRAVYKGGLKGAYAGEATGIKGGLVRSIKLS